MYAITIKPATLKKWAEMEDQNEHGERLQEIAEYCARRAADRASVGALDVLARDTFAILGFDFQKINIEHCRAGYLTPELYDAREICRQYLRLKIRDHFGAGTLELINP